MGVIPLSRGLSGKNIENLKTLHNQAISFLKTMNAKETNKGPKSKQTKKKLGDPLKNEVLFF